MSIVINLYGGPGTGKTTTATRIFSNLKSAGVNAEYVQEYVKQWAWEDRVPGKYDQFYFFGKQLRREYSLFKNVNTIITDSPVSLCAFYSNMLGGEEQGSLFVKMAQEFYKEVEKDGHDYVHVWLNRVKPYNEKGRFQTEDQAKEIDTKLKEFLKDKFGVNFIEIDGTNEAADNFSNVLLQTKVMVRK